MENFIKSVFKEVIESPVYDEALIDKYFSDDFHQSVDGQILDNQTFKKHIFKLKSKTLKQRITFLNIISNDTHIFTNHLVESKLNNGNVVKHKVLAEFYIENGKVRHCDELTILVGGDHINKNLASEV